MTPDLTATRVREVLAYDPETGVFTWKVRTSNRVSVGDVAGATGANGYTQIGIDGKRWLAHRLAWLYVHGEWPEDEIDHMNGLRTDNRLANLRAATRAANMQNLRPHPRRPAGMMGASWNKRRRAWEAQIKVSGRKVHLGFFGTSDQAHDAYITAKRQFHEFCTI